MLILYILLSEIIYLFFFFLRTFITAEVFLNHLGFLDHIRLTNTVGLLWTSYEPVAEASTYTRQHNIETQETNIHALSGIRTCDPSNQAAADLRLRPCGYWGRHLCILTLPNDRLHKRFPLKFCINLLFPHSSCSPIPTASPKSYCLSKRGPT
jgi:hypothetical protein